MFRKCEVCVDLFEIPLIHNGDQPIAFSRRRTCSKECHLYLRGCKIANAHLEAQKHPHHKHKAKILQKID